MNAEYFLKFSQIAMLIGGFLLASGGYGAYYFKRIIEKEDQYQHEQQLTDMGNKLDKIVDTPLATQEDFEQLKKLITEKPLNLPIEEVKNELELEIRFALKKQKEMALSEYEIGNGDYYNNSFKSAIKHFENALKILKTPSFYMALANGYYMISENNLAYSNWKISRDLLHIPLNSATSSGITRPPIPF